MKFANVKENQCSKVVQPEFFKNGIAIFKMLGFFLICWIFFHEHWIGKKLGLTIRNTKTNIYFTKIIHLSSKWNHSTPHMNVQQQRNLIYVF